MSEVIYTYVTDGELAVGDVILDHTLMDLGGRQVLPLLWRSERYGAITWKVGFNRGGFVCTDMGNVICRLGSDVTFKIRRASVVKDSGRWNGKCACGLGTYTSCFSVEHEGGKCEGF